MLEAVELPAGISHLQLEEAPFKALFLKRIPPRASSLSYGAMSIVCMQRRPTGTGRDKQHAPEPSRPRSPGYRPGRCGWR